MNEPLRIMIIAGEPSGDLHAAPLMAALRRQSARPPVFRGVGGDAMAAAGAEILFHTNQTAVMGFAEVARNLRFLRRMMRRLLQELDSWQPHLVITVDYPGFNLRFAAAAHARGIRTIQYISPKVWAWNSGRIPRIARAFDALLAIFPFEPECYRETPLPVTYVGNPLVDRAAETLAAPPPRLPWGSQARRLALLPGSRRAEILRIFPTMLAAAALLDSEIAQGVACVVPTPNRAIRDLAETVARRTTKKPAQLHFIDGQARAVLHQAEAAIVASGTATLEACLMRCPAVLVYRMHPASALLARLLVRGTPHVGLVNIIARRCGISGKTVMPELLQWNFTAAATAAAVRDCLDNAAARASTLAAYDDVIRALGAGGVSERAAQAVLRLLRDAGESHEPQPPTTTAGA